MRAHLAPAPAQFPPGGPTILADPAEAFVALAAGRLRFDHRRKRWLVKTPGGWKDDDGAAMRVAGQVAEAAAGEAARSGDPKALHRARQMGMIGKMSGLIRLARTDHRLAFVEGA